MSREWVLLFLLALASVAVVVGCAQLSVGAAWVVGGVLFALLSLLALVDTK